MRKARIIPISPIVILASLIFFAAIPNTHSADPRFISSINPSSVLAGKNVFLTGTNLYGTVQVTNAFGGANSVSGTINSDKTEVSFIFPSDLPRGTYQIKVGPNDTDVSNEVPLTILEGAKPVITGIDPTQVKAASGQSVTISGTNLGTSNTSSNPVVKLEKGSDTFSAAGEPNPGLTKVLFDVPADAPVGEYTVTLTTDDGTATSPTKLKVIESTSTFTPPPGPTPPTQGLPTNLGQLIGWLFGWSLALLGVAVFVMFFYAGILWFTAAGNTARVNEAKSRMTNAVVGAILLLSSYLILNTINPNFVKNTFNLPGIGGGNESGGGGFVNCDNPPDTISPDPMPTMQQVRSESEFAQLDLKDEIQGGGRDKFTTEVAKRLHNADDKWGRKKSSSGAPVSTDTLGYLRPDVGSGRFEAVDIILGSSGTLQRGCVGVVGSQQVWVAP